MSGPAVLTLLAGSAVIAAGISATVTLVLQHVTSIREDTARRRDIYARALQACAAYREFPFVIRRRRHDDPAAERARLSEALRAVQQDLTFYSAWIESESTDVGNAFRALLKETRTVAGGFMAEAWKKAPAAGDEDMNVAGITYATIEPLERAYLDAVREHLKPWWQQLGRWI